MTKTCKRCGEEKLISEYYKAKGCIDNLRPVCKKCIYAQTISFKEKNPEHYKARRRHAGLRYLYGIGEKEYEEMFKKQGHMCDICRTPQDELNRKLAVDHCHNSGKVRALLCDSCNRGLGYFKHCRLTLDRASKYMLNHEE